MAVLRLAFVVSSHYKRSDQPPSSNAKLENCQIDSKVAFAVKAVVFFIIVILRRDAFKVVYYPRQHNYLPNWCLHIMVPKNKTVIRTFNWVHCFVKKKLYFLKEFRVSRAAKYGRQYHRD